VHPQDVADLVNEEVVELQQQLDDHHDLRVRELARPHATEIMITFGAKAYASQVVSQGLIVPGAGGFQQQAHRVPILGQTVERDLILRVRCDNWDGDAAEFDLLDAGEAQLADWPKDTTGRGIVHNHPDYARPFFCRPGTREYHSHPVHKDDPWDKHREGATLAGITVGLLNDLANRWTMRE
jgi:hypothetical protein